MRTASSRATRRHLLAALVATPVGLAAGAALSRARPVAGALRPPATGTSVCRCAACGGEGHTMLDAACPAAPEVV